MHGSFRRSALADHCSPLHLAARSVLSHIPSVPLLSPRCLHPLRVRQSKRSQWGDGRADGAAVRAMQRRQAAAAGRRAEMRPARAHRDDAAGAVQSAGGEGASTRPSQSQSQGHLRFGRGRLSSHPPLVCVIVHRAQLHGTRQLLCWISSTCHSPRSSVRLAVAQCRVRWSEQ